ncbi:MAG: hypothetical protein H0V45_02525 [Actinobacteria bacterium]|nr:hypothetical protein [Actinomycetota bacterium]
MFCLVHGLAVGQASFDPLARELGGELLRPELREPMSIPDLAAQVEVQLPEPAVVVASPWGVRSRRSSPCGGPSSSGHSC